MSFTLDSAAKLNNGIQIPRLGLGVYQIPRENQLSKQLNMHWKLAIDTLIQL